MQNQNNKNSLSEATYIKNISDRKQNEKRKNKKVQRIVSSMVVLFCVAFVIVGSMNLVSSTSNAYVINVDGEEVATMVSKKEAQEALDLCLAKQIERYQSEYAFEVSYINNVEIQEISSVGVVYANISEASELLADCLDLVADAVQLQINGETAFYVASEMDAIQAVNIAKGHYGSSHEEDVLNVYTSEQISMQAGKVSCDDVLSAGEGANMLIYGQLEPTLAPQPLVTVNVERQQKNIVPLPYETVRVDNPELNRGTEQVVAEGEDGTQEVTLKIVEVNGVPVSSEQTDAEVITAAVDEIVEVGTLLMVSSRGTNGSGEFGWPLASGTGMITSRFGWRSRGWHSGVDIADPVGTAIYASESGTVTAVESQSGYGNIVIIDHGSGVETRYAHCDEMLVNVGDYVSRGDAVATIGMTGTTTGPHVHFEIRIDGTAVDPLPYLE